MKQRRAPSASPSVPISANKVLSQLSNSQSVQSGVPRVERVSRVAAPVPGRPGSVAGGHVREPYTVFNAVTRGRRAVASVASHDSKPSLRGVSGAWRWTSIRLFPALTDPGQRDMPRPAAGVRGRARGGSDRLDGIIRPRDVHSSSRAPRARRLAPSGYAP